MQLLQHDCRHFDWRVSSIPLKLTPPTVLLLMLFRSFEAAVPSNEKVRGGSHIFHGIPCGATKPFGG